MEIDKNYTAHPKYKKIKGLPFTVEEVPEKFSKEEVPPWAKESFFSQFDDEKITMTRTSDKDGYNYLSKLCWYGSAAMFFLMFFIPAINDRDPSLAAVIAGTLTPAFLAVFLRFKVRKYPEDLYITFYRHSGLIALPNDGKGSGSFIIRFEDLKSVITSITTPNFHSGPQLRFFREYTTGFNLFKHFEWIIMSWSNNPMEYWSFYVWYMDKNRPLPPGSAFDPYRKKDYERRKAEGFPAPLYESKIPTPEYVPGSDSSIVDNLN